ncbi:GAP family protein [Nocardioides sp. ChNu-99]|uniref:GAP family protein n=1 Tax=Nocardioides sp. ChNu-99 TaxID=2839897 RepID=UPI0024054714|nr:GAP family protein [Nocardioides sp. ChNu-99]MDF9717298.1 GAP family protein [Nocardioides sp. ChNu-99]
MDLVTLGLLAGLALVDSTSIGTLVLPLVLLTAPRVDVRRYLVFLGTVGGFYALVGIGLVLGADAAVRLLAEVGDLTWLRWVELVVGGVLLTAGLVGDLVLARVRRWRAPRGAVGGAVGGAVAGEPAATPRRTASWRSRLVGPGASYRVVVGVGLAAALVEVASMLPFLGAVGIITAADLPLAASVGVVVAYALVMVAPALLLLAGRLALGSRVEGPLARFSGWLERVTSGASWWVFAVVGLLLVGDASRAFDLG